MAVRSILKGLTGGGSGAADASVPREVSVISAGDSARRLQVLDEFERAGIGWIWASDEEGRLIYLSGDAIEKLGRPANEVMAQPLISLFETDPDNPDERSDRPLNFQLNTRSKINQLTVRVIADGDKRLARSTWWSISGHPMFDAGGKFLGYRGSAKDVTVEYERKIIDSRMAEYDALTGLANRHRMNRRLESILSAYKSARRACALMMLDLDRFKYVNDTMGHPAGDELLRQVADRLRSIVGNRGEIGRLGGDEFQVILPDLDDRGKLGELAEKIIQIISQPYPIDGKRAIIGTSVGVAIAPYDGIEKDEITRASDLALYAAKNGGRGQFRFYSSDLKDEEEERRLLLDDLREALATDQIQLHYQPVVRTKDHVVVGFEGLMRWEHPERGNVSPGIFIPAAEESNLINQLGEWALRRACEDAAQWPETVRVAVNVSAVQFNNNGFVAVVTNALAHAGLAPDRLELELTESVFMGDSEQTDRTFRELKELGVRLALDDFGTGYSSLSYLRSAPFDKLKVDKSFVDSCTQKDQNSAKIITAIIGLSEALGMETTVEGVEAFDQFNLVCSKGAKYIQGWIYSKALPREVVLEGMSSGEMRIEPSGPEKHRPERRSVFRRVGVIHDDHRYDAMMRNLSTTGAMVEGLLGVPVGTGLVLDLGEGQLAVGVVNRSEDAAQWPETVRVAVNVSAVQFNNNGFVAVVTNALAHAGLAPDRLELELTESVFMGDSEQTDRTFRELKELGVRLALDDFGTGYSSLSYLRSAPFDKLKVDKSFVDSCTQKDQNSAKIITAIIGLSEALGMETTVEGVEAFDQFNLVCSKGAKYIQGWIYSKALPREEILQGMSSGEMRIEPSGPEKHRPERRSVFRRVGVIHDDHRYDAMMRNLSTTGAMVEGLLGVPVGTGLVLDLGEGQLAVGVVNRSEDAMVGIEFETPLVSDGAGGLCTRHRVSPYALAAAGMPLAALPPGNYPLTLTGGPSSKPQFIQVTSTLGAHAA